jgi:hypothetical protein
VYNPLPVVMTHQRSILVTGEKLFSAKLISHAAFELPSAVSLLSAVKNGWGHPERFKPPQSVYKNTMQCEFILFIQILCRNLRDLNF